MSRKWASFRTSGGRANFLIRLEIPTRILIIGHLITIFQDRYIASSPRINLIQSTQLILHIRNTNQLTQHSVELPSKGSPESGAIELVMRGFIVVMNEGLQFDKLGVVIHNQGMHCEQVELPLLTSALPLHQLNLISQLLRPILLNFHKYFI